MEIIKTDHPVLQGRSAITKEIATFWNKTSEGFRQVWGPHIHHGYFEDHSETPLNAQEHLIEKLTALLDISAGDKILDAGCGMGGSSLYLAKKYNVAVAGVSLSQRQVDMAAQFAEEDGVTNVHFKVEDALSLESFPDNAFDIVWSLESCEQFFDKSLFIRQAFRVLKPGGDLMLATWCSNAEEYRGRDAKEYKRLCAAFQLPYMPTINWYAQALLQQGFVCSHMLNWSNKVGESWKIGRAALKAHSLLDIFKLSGWRGLTFVKNAKLMQDGFDDGHVEYGVFVARKPLHH